MFVLSLMLVASLPNYNDLPNPRPSDIHSCAVASLALETFVQRFKTVVFNHEIDRGGRMTWEQGNSIRYAADITVRPYVEHLREIAYTGDVQSCREISRDGINAVTENVIRPVFGK